MPVGTVQIDAMGLLDEKPNNVLQGGDCPDVPFAPMVTVQTVPVRKPDLENGWSLCRAIGSALEEARDIPLSVLQKLPGLMDTQQLWCVFHGQELLDLRRDSRVYGLAVDIGTTTVAVALMDLTTRENCGEDGFVNPQKAFGLDVLSRIHYDMENPGGVSSIAKVTATDALIYESFFAVTFAIN